MRGIEHIRRNSRNQLQLYAAVAVVVRLEGKGVSEKPGKYRIAILACGALDLFMVGTTYLYGVFQPYIMEYFNVDSAVATTPFTLVWMFMTVAQFIAGPLQKHLGVKITECIGLALMAVGYLGCSMLAPNQAQALILLYSVVIGLGLGIAYNAVAATSVRWFPDRKGLATSVSIGMMGGAGVLLAPVFGSVLATSGLVLSFRYLALMYVPCIVLTMRGFSCSCISRSFRRFSSPTPCS